MTYLLRGIDSDLWQRVKVRAAKDGVSMRAVLIRLLRAYVAGRA